VDITNVNIDRVFDVLQIRFDHLITHHKRLEQKMADVEQRMANMERQLGAIAALLKRRESE
jgi:hypothetical protein